MERTVRVYSKFTGETETEFYFLTSDLNLIQAGGGGGGDNNPAGFSLLCWNGLQ